MTYNEIGKLKKKKKVQVNESNKQNQSHLEFQSLRNSLSTWSVNLSVAATAVRLHSTLVDRIGSGRELELGCLGTRCRAAAAVAEASRTSANSDGTELAVVDSMVQLMEVSVPIVSLSTADSSSAVCRPVVAAASEPMIECSLATSTSFEYRHLAGPRTTRRGHLIWVRLPAHCYF